MTKSQRHTHVKPTAVHRFSFAHSMTASRVVTGLSVCNRPPAMPACCSSRWFSCEMRSSSVPEPMAYFLNSYSREALSAEMMNPAVPSALQ